MMREHDYVIFTSYHGLCFDLSLQYLLQGPY
jgi:hypothetical protein